MDETEIIPVQDPQGLQSILDKLILHQLLLESGSHRTP